MSYCGCWLCCDIYSSHFVVPSSANVVSPRSSQRPGQPALQHHPSLKSVTEEAVYRNNNMVARRLPLEDEGLVGLLAQKTRDASAIEQPHPSLHLGTQNGHDDGVRLRMKLSIAAAKEQLPGAWTGIASAKAGCWSCESFGGCARLGTCCRN